MDGNIDKVREALYKIAESMAHGWANWAPDEAYKTGFETGIDKSLAALSAVDPEAHLDGMHDEERIVLLLEHVGDSWGKDDGHDVQLVRDAFSIIRRECADKAVAWSRKPFPDGMDCKSLEETREYIEAGLKSAILSAEPAQEVRP